MKDILQMFSDIWPEYQFTAYGSSVYRLLLGLAPTNTDIDIVTNLKVTRVGLHKAIASYFDVIDLVCEELRAKGEGYQIDEITKRYVINLADGRTIDLVFVDSKITVAQWYTSKFQASTISQCSASYKFGNFRIHTTPNFDSLSTRAPKVELNSSMATKEHRNKINKVLWELKHKWKR